MSDDEELYNRDVLLELRVSLFEGFALGQVELPHEAKMIKNGC